MNEEDLKDSSLAISFEAIYMLVNILIDSISLFRKDLIKILVKSCTLSKFLSNLLLSIRRIPLPKYHLPLTTLRKPWFT